MGGASGKVVSILIFRFSLQAHFFLEGRAIWKWSETPFYSYVCNVCAIWSVCWLLLQLSFILWIETRRNPCHKLQFMYRVSRGALGLCLFVLSVYTLERQDFNQYICINNCHVYWIMKWPSMKWPHVKLFGDKFTKALEGKMLTESAVSFLIEQPVWISLASSLNTLSERYSTNTTESQNVKYNYEAYVPFSENGGMGFYKRKCK